MQNNQTYRRAKRGKWSKVLKIVPLMFFLTLPLPQYHLGGTPSVFAQQLDSGMIDLEVLDPSSMPYVGATVTLINSAGQAVGQKHTTNQRGQVQIPAVPGGDYTIQVESSDKYEVLKEPITVVNGQIISTSLRLYEKNVIEVTAVKENPIEKLDLPQGTFDTKTLKSLPLLSKEFDQALPTVPNVIRGPDGKVSIKGARENQSLLLINGYDGSDPATGESTKTIPLESIGNVQVYTNPYLPEYGKFTGGVVKLETKRGGDKFKFELDDIFPEPRFRGGKLFGITNFSPRIHLEGPIIKNRLSFAQGVEYDIDKKPVRGLPSPINEIKRQVFRSFTQFDLIVNDHHTLTTTINFSPRKLQNIGLDFFNPQVVAPNQNATDISVAGVDRVTLSNGSLLETIVQYKRIDSRVFGKGSNFMEFTPLGRDGNYFHTEDRKTNRYEFGITNTFAPFVRSGVHNVKYGINLGYLDNSGTTNNNTIELRRTDGTLAQKIQYFTVGALNTNNSQVAAFAQDQWTIKPNFSLDYGVRLEAQRATAGISVMPRVAISYSPNTKGNTVIRSAFGLFYDKVPLNVLSFVNAPRFSTTNFATDGQTIIGGPLNFFNLLAPRPNGKPNNGTDFAAPRNLTFNVQIDQKVNPNVLLRVSFIESRTEHDLYVSPVSENGINAIKLFNDGTATYRSLEVTGSVKLPKNNDFSVSYVRSQAKGELNDFNTYYGDFPEAIIRPNQFGRLSSDAPNRVIARGTFKLPARFTVVPLLDVHTGFPYSIRDELQNFVGERNSVRFPRFATLDMAISKAIKFKDKYDTEFTVSLFNVTDHFNPRNIKANIADPGFGTFFASYRRFYRLDFAVTW